MIELFANSVNPDQRPHSVASDLGLHCLPITLLGVCRLQWVKPGLRVYMSFSLYVLHCSKVHVVWSCVIIEPFPEFLK